MNIQVAKEQIKDTVEAYLRTDDAGMPAIAPVHQRPIFLLGAPGIGKTAVMAQVARELGIGLVSYSMTHHTRQSALGLPRIEHKTFEGFDYDASEYTMSEIVAALYDYMERTGLRQGILFLDEINCVSETLYPSMLQFLQFKTFSKHRVPEGWVIACAGNPPAYNRSVHEFDIVTLDRLREIDVEPDYTAWKGYAAAQGLHPAVTTFLEAKQDCFYKVESKPGGGKAFVTARGWEDLAEIIALYEDMGKPVGRDLIAQFLRDDDIADKFAVYYALFEKYRSEYQVDAILAGTVDEGIKARAREAAFDERVALLGLLLDAVAADCARALERESLMVELRDVLRAAKPELLAGARVEEALGARIAEREATCERMRAAGTASAERVRRERLVLERLREFAAQCAHEGVVAGEEAFRVIERAYKAEVAQLEPQVMAADEKINRAFDFVSACFGSREMLVFMVELTTRQATTQFIARYGNENYYAHNEELQVDAARMGLSQRVSQLAGMDEQMRRAEERSVGAPDAVAITTGAKPAHAAGETSGRSVGAPRGLKKHGTVDIPAEAPAWTREGVSGAAAGAEGAAAVSADELRAHYGGKQFEYGFSSICKMVLPVSELKNKKVLDICCRRGRGVYKLSSIVGERGSVLGVDWSQAYIDEANDGMTRAWHDSGLSASNMEFRVAYPEDLIGAGIGSATMDAVYVNNVMTLFYDQELALREFGRVLKPGGLLIMETIFADRVRNEEIVAQARALGNSIQAARTQEENYAWLSAAGFATPAIQEEYAVKVDRGFEAGHSVPFAEGDEDVRYRAVSLYVWKK